MVSVVHIAEDFATTGGGVTTAIAELSGQLARIGLKQKIIFAGEESIPAPEGVQIQGLRLVSLAKKWRYPRGIKAVLSHTLTDDSVVHLHGIWMAPQYLAVALSRKKGIPVVLSAHNMLGEWFWKDGLARQIKKTIYWQCLSGPRFKKV